MAFPTTNYDSDGAAFAGLVNVATANGYQLQPLTQGGMLAAIVANMMQATPPDAVPVGDIVPGTARQVIQTNAGGTAAEWSSSLALPGSLAAGTTITAGTGLTVTSGGATITAGGLTVTAGGLTVSASGITVTGNSTITGTLGGLTGLTVASGGLTVTAGGAVITAGGLTVSASGITVTGNSTITGTLGGLTGLTVASGGASITGATAIVGAATIGDPAAASAHVFAGTGYGAGVASIRLNGLTTAAVADQTGTLTNAPSAGNPVFWIPINIAGSVRYIPAWA